jgi:sugar fermentation stimulation protein A
LLEGRLIKRYKRFFADVELLSGEIVTAHCANTGSMKTCGSPGDVVYLLHAPNPKRKLAYNWELTRTKGGYIGVNTSRPNHVVAGAIEGGLIPELKGYAEIRQEVKYGANSRIDILLTDDRKGLCYVEVKNTTMLAGNAVVFPDAVSSRGLKHLQELEQMVRDGHRAVMFYLVNRPEGAFFAPAADIDPDYAAGLDQARKNGVEILAYRAQHDLEGIRIGDKVALKF